MRDVRETNENDRMRNVVKSYIREGYSERNAYKLARLWSERMEEFRLKKLATRAAQEKTNG